MRHAFAPSLAMPLALTAWAWGPWAPASAAPAVQLEAVEDADGYLGLKPGEPLVLARHSARWGAPSQSIDMGPGRHRWVWGPTAQEQEGRGLGPRGLAVEAKATPLGWVTTWVYVGAERHPRPTLLGIAPLEGDRLRGRLEALVDEGWSIEAPMLGVAFTSDALGHTKAFEAVRLKPLDWPGQVRHSAQVHEALNRWAADPRRVDVAAMKAHLEHSPEGLSLLSPAVVISVRPAEGGFVQAHLRLPQHSLAIALGPNGERPALKRQNFSLRLPSGGSARSLKPGDLVVVSADWEGFVTGPGVGERDRSPRARVLLGEPSLAATFPRGFVHHELWQGAPNPGLAP